MDWMSKLRRFCILHLLVGKKDGAMDNSPESGFLWTNGIQTSSHLSQKVYHHLFHLPQSATFSHISRSQVGILLFIDSLVMHYECPTLDWLDINVNALIWGIRITRPNVNAA